MPLTLVRRPRSPRVLHDIIKSEVRNAYKKLGATIIQRLLNDIREWEGKPDFKVSVVVSSKVWRIDVSYDSKARIGQIYIWVDKGTGEFAGGEGYDIFPVNADALHFFSPYEPKTTTGIGGIPGIVLVPAGGEQDEVYSKHVFHRGIRPRNFTKSLKDEMKQRERIGAFRSTTEAAIKRGARKIGANA